MRRNATRTLSQGAWRHLLATVLILTTLGLIIGTGATAWYRPCRVSLFTLSRTPSCPSLLEDLVPLLVALGFWAVSLLAQVSGQGSTSLGFFLGVASVLALGKLFDTGGLSANITVRLFYLILAWLAPLTFHFYHHLLVRPLGRIGRIVLVGLWSQAIVCSLPLLWPFSQLLQENQFEGLRLVIRITFASVFLLATPLLFLDYRNRASPVVRRRIRLIVFGTVCAFTPMLFLSLLPETLRASFYVPYELTFPWLLLSPLAYGYSLFQHRLVWAEVALSRAGMYFILVTLLLSVYLLAGIVFAYDNLGLTDLGWLPIAIFNIGLLLLLVPLQQQLRRLTDWVLYGREISYTDVVERLTNALAVTLDQMRLKSLLQDQLASQMRLSGTGLLLRDQDGGLTVVAIKGLISEGSTPIRIPIDGPLTTLLEAAAEPLEVSWIQQVIADPAMSREESLLLSLPNVAFWLPLIAAERLQGVLIVGRKVGGDFFTTEDLRILTTLARQAGIAANNVRLTEQLQAGRQELALAHQELLVGREHERRRLAREVHDGVIQHLLFVNLTLSQAYKRVMSYSTDLQALVKDLEAAQRGVLDVVGQLRTLIGELRPPGLEEVGLSGALEAYVVDMQREQGVTLPHIYLKLDRSPVTLPEPVAICLFRVAQEALRNALKHAKAQHIILSLRFLPTEALLTVKDDGRGFQVPQRLSELVRAKHFGLVGLVERVASVRGQVTIQSQPGVGTEVVVQVPIGKEDSST